MLQYPKHNGYSPLLLPMMASNDVLTYKKLIQMPDMVPHFSNSVTDEEGL